MNINKTLTIIIAGPTASGKTCFSIELAKLINGEIINADAMQLYSGFNILKATPSKKEMNGITHHLFGSIDMDFSNYNYKTLNSSNFSNFVKKKLKKKKQIKLVNDTVLKIREENNKR